VLPQAQNRWLTEDFVKEQFGRLGGTPYELNRLTMSVSGRPFAPASLLNSIRREAVEKLIGAQTASKPVELHRPDWQIAPRRCAPSEPQIHLLVRTPEQLEAAISATPASITLDYLDLYGLKPSVDGVKASGIAVRVASPRILKPGEDRVVNFLLKLGCPLLVRSAGLLETVHGLSGLTGDFSLNAANALTANLLLDRGLERITPAHDLNGAQIASLAEEIGGGVIEAIAYGHLPVFHTEHCVFCRFLSTGTTYKDCGRPCEKHQVSLRDAGGRQHPIIADVGCRNTVFGAEAQQASAHMDAWIDAGIRHFRLEFVHESADEVKRVTAAFSRYLSGVCNRRQLAEELRRIAPQGITEGSLFVPSDYRQLPILQ
jgi:putative protease